MKPVNETSNEIMHETSSEAKRLTHRNSPERLLACLEDIDDDLISEAAQAVNNPKTPIWQRFSPGSAAAVFIGAVAMSCILLLAMWLTNAGPLEPPPAHYHEYGENGQDAHSNENNNQGNPPPEIPPTETPAPYRKGDLIPGGILPLPQIRATSSEVILPAHQSHMTINNPWHDRGHVNTLPVFRTHATSTWDRTRGQHITDMYLTNEEWNQFINSLYEDVRAIAVVVGISPDELPPARSVDHVSAPLAYRFHSIAHMQIGGISLRINLPHSEMVSLPQGASIANYAGNREVQLAIAYLSQLMPSAISMELPVVTNAQRHLDTAGNANYHRQRFFDAGGSPEDAILAFNFEWVEILTLNPHRPEWIEMGLFPHRQFESLQLGHYPIITPEEAREMLLAGYFISEFPDSRWPGRERAANASVELVYHIPEFNNDEEAIMPFYRFLVEVELPLWYWRITADEPGAYRAFIRYYVPAVHRDYLEPMPRRQLSDPPPAPTGPRALPPELFVSFHGMDEDTWWRAMPVHRQHVAALWDEVMAEIGELAVNEAYQFRTACGNYAMITGNRSFQTREELHRYFPGMGWDETAREIYRYTPGHDLPETVGDFRLRQISVFDQTQDIMFIYHRPMATFEDIFAFNATDPAPVGEIFTREPFTFSIYAMYENSQGVQVGLGISMPIMGLHFLPEEPHTVIDMAEYGQIYFQGHPGQYFRALYEPRDPWLGFVIELWLANSGIQGRQTMWDLGYGHWHGSPEGFSGTHWFTPVERAALEELVRIFNPAALAAEYDWNLMSLQ